MSTNAINANTNPLTDLVQNLTKRYDADNNGSLSADEFGNFLSQFLNNTNSTFAPGTAATTRPGADAGPVGIMEGFDPAKLADPNHNSGKYQVGRILQNFPNTPQGLRDALPLIQQLAPNARIIGTHGDKIDFGGYVDGKQNTIGIIDVLRSASTGGAGWQWGED